MNVSDDLIALDSSSRERALELASFIVEAPAGAGKTELLTQRYLRLLAVVDEPEEIIALTFTNKAAAEMRNRILLSLERAENQIPETENHKLKTRELAIVALKRANERGWQLLTQPARLRVMTIDALCSSLARQMPLLSRFGGQPNISDDTEAHYMEAARRTMSGIVSESKADDTVTTALRYMDNDAIRLTNLLAKMLARRDQWLPLAGQHAHVDELEIEANIESALDVLIRQDLQKAYVALPPSIQILLMPVARYAASNLKPDHVFSPLLDWQTPLEARLEYLVLWRAVSEFLLPKLSKGVFRKADGLNKTFGFPSSDKASEAHRQTFGDICNLIADPQPLLDLRSLPDSSMNNGLVIKAIARLLQLATAHLWTVFQAANEVDFVAIAHSAKTALENESGATDLALKLDYRISHLLIDEFQDTSPVQMGLVQQLIQGWEPGDGRTLFCVGDPMQSIYRFRKADVSLFLQATERGIAHLPLTRLQLTRNNRSHPEVVKWINEAFEWVFPATDNINQGAISYREFTATRDPIADEGVVIHPLLLNADTEGSTAKIIEADYVANLIVQERAKNKTAKIAVLVRSRSHLRELVSEIRRSHRGLDFQAVEIEELSNRQTVQDALSLTRALLHRADRVHWLSLLRAPWCGLTLADLYALAVDSHQATIWQLMWDEARLGALSADGRQRLLHVREVLDEAFSHQGRMPVRRWLESTWLKMGGAACLVDAGDNRDVQAFFDLVEKLSRGNHLDFTELEAAMEKLYAKPDEKADDTLQFLTIHKSKGLEFDTVILPALNRKPRHPDSDLVLWEEVIVDDELQLIAAPFVPNKKSASVSVYQYLQGLEQERSANETARLLYVAATRTERKLHLIGTIRPTKEGEIKPVQHSLLELLWQNLQADFEQATPVAIDLNGEIAPDISQFTPQLKRLAAAEIPATLQPKSPSNHALPGSLDAPPGDALNQHYSLESDIGILAHRYVELIAEQGLQSWSAKRVQGLQPAMRRWLEQQGHNQKEAEQGAVKVAVALSATLTSEQGRWVLQARDGAVSELAVATAENDGIAMHVIDRTFVENGVRWIIDYKSAQLDASLADAALSQQAENYRPQLERYAAVFMQEGLPIRKAVFFLALGKLIELV